MPFKAIIFDLDGTLLNTIEDLRDSMNLALAEHGYPTFGTEAYKVFVGNGMRKLAERALAGTGADEAAVRTVLNAFKEHYGRLQRAKTRPYPGIPETLASLRGKGIRLAVLSNKADLNTQAVVNYFFPEHPFEFVVGQREGVPTKPDPAGALSIASAMGLAPGDILYVGDTGVDMNTAGAAGMYSLGVLWGFRSEKELVENGARRIIERPEQILGVVTEK